MMLSSMFSQAKQDRQETLLALVELIETLIRVGTKFNNPQAFDLAEELGKVYFELKNKT